jgi:hypothetical protein
MSAPKTHLNLKDLLDHPRNLKKVLGVYLDLKKPYKVKERKYTFGIFSACGVGKDGESQIFAMRENFDFFRRYQNGELRDLPIESGMLYAMLLDMGYELNPSREIRGMIYKKVTANRQVHFWH